MSRSIPHVLSGRSFGHSIRSAQTNYVCKRSSLHSVRAQKHTAELWIGNSEGEPEWEKVASGAMDKLSRTVAFHVDDWDGTASKLYQVRFGWRNETHIWEGPDPARAELGRTTEAWMLFV